MNPLHHAVVVGINYYPGMSDLLYAEKDAQTFYKWVTSPEGGGVLPEHAHLIPLKPPAKTKRAYAEPTRKSILDALEECVEINRLHLVKHPEDWPQTRLYFFAAGHGIAPSPLDAALLAANASSMHLNEHISSATLIEYFSRVQHFKELVLFADCCRTEERLATALPPPWTEDSLKRGNVSRFFAAGASFFQRSFERLDGTPDEQRGYFTRALLDGLSGGAQDENGTIDSISGSRLKTFITEHMRRNSMIRFPLKPLEPDFLVAGNDEVFFGPSRTKPPATHYPVRIKVEGMPFAALAVTKGDPGSPLIATSRSADGAAYECNLPVGLWEAIPMTGTPPIRSPRNWIFKVNEEGGEYAFSVPAN